MENSKYITKGGKVLRTGYTTGSCGAAASKASAYMLFNNKILDKVEIDTPKGWKLVLDVNDPVITPSDAICYIVKDAGDDPDITDGIHIYARARKMESTGVKIKAGKGIGRVTKAGLEVKPGNPAINPVPMKMIEEQVLEVLPRGCGVEIELFIPRGEELAKKTYNPKLGIVGGLSILGTSGIVEPMSEKAIMDTIALELSCRKSEGYDAIVLVPGNYGKKFCTEWTKISEKRMVKISNYLGFALEKCKELGFQSIILAGHLGKLIKPAGGTFYTHSRVSDTRMEILTAYLGVMGLPMEKLVKVMECGTTEEAMMIIEENGYEEIYSIIAEKCASRCEDYIYKEINIGVVLFSMKNILAQSRKVKSILEEITNE